MTLGGTLIVRDAIKYDYCVLEAVRSLAPICSQFVILDCGSTDGTLDQLQTLSGEFPQVEIHQGGDWECLPDYYRLSELTNRASALLKTKWHFNIQADEVLHESCWPSVLEAIKGPPKPLFVRRLNLFGDVDRMLRQTHEVEQPCGTVICRLAPARNRSMGDAENLYAPPGADMSFCNRCTLFHYSFVRRDKEHIRKIIDVQSWFWGAKSVPDQRAVKMEPEGKFHWDQFKPAEWLSPLPMPHPQAAMTWVNRRRLEQAS